MRKIKRAQQRHIRREKFRQRAIAAGAAAAITLGAGVSVHKALAGLPADPHQRAVSCDADADLLANREESTIGYRVFDPDQNRNGILDGVELAKRCCAVVRGLPAYPPGGPPPSIKETYKIEHALDGLELCEVCPQWIQMGGWEIINPVLGLRYPDPNDPMEKMFLPDLALHYMEHGSFDCYGSRHKGRVDIARLLRVVELRYPYDPNEHQLLVDGNDLDGDLLTDSEEPAAGYDLYDADQDSNIVPDGIELAKQCAEAVDALPVHDQNTPAGKEPYKVDYFQKGIEHCHICPKIVNMGYWLVINPKLGLSVQVPDIVCHYMQHGSFSYAGDIHGKGRIDVALLVKILEMPTKCGDLGTIYLPGDLNKDCKVDFKDFAEFANQWLGSTDPNDGGCNK
jgi:hypothetical protein